MHGDFFINDWLIQPQINTVEKNGRTWHLEPKVMQVLVHLSSHPNQVLSKEKLIDSVWHGTFVGDDVLVRCISEIRYVFGDDPRSPFVIQTIPKAGYRLIASVRADPSSQANEAHAVQSATDRIHEAGASSAQTTATVIAPETKATEASALEHEAIASVNPAPRPQRRWLWTLLVAAICIAIAVTAYFWRTLHPTPFDAFWQPVLSSSAPALFCVADQNQYSFITLRDAAEPTKQVVLKDNLSAVVIDDLDTIVKIASTLRTHGKHYQLKGEESTSLSDLRNGPSIFIGAFDNAWTLRFTKALRFHFANNPEMTRFEIVDRNNPSASSWVVDRTQQLATNNYVDYAIIARFVDDTTGEPAVIVAGVGRGGTIAAGEFLTNSDDLAQLAPAMKSAGNKKNIEIVLSTQIIDGQPGTPKVEAVHFW
ncbi:transcriptional regulator [Edaphobacter sp.]|uniref:transcriptional regulator n=1 Tax=Edaphobacter sp. TaxID=1934404 RepID=UPI002DBBF6E0|nr:winged helix-turn-helix domain-containing protein [Edaphobacter sp.]HEU5341787.1 winged helix-turn-helix domain-containing protein [Edaphobacter sp.]